MSQTTIICARTGHQLFNASFYSTQTKIDSKTCQKLNSFTESQGLVYVLVEPSPNCKLSQTDQKHELNTPEKRHNRCCDFDSWSINNLDSLLTSNLDPDTLSSLFAVCIDRNWLRD